MSVALGGVLAGSQGRIVRADDIGAHSTWWTTVPKDDRQRVLWPRSINFSRDYFESLLNHAVPLDERALGALSNSAMALDIYAWLSQRLHRVDPRRTDFIPWPVVQRQFGQGFARLRKFREKFPSALADFRAVYPAARVETNLRGVSLHHSAPPVAYRTARRFAQA